MTTPDTAPEELEFEVDNLSRNGAKNLAARLDAYWRAQGATTVRHWVEHVRNQGGQQSAVFVVRSNLVGGRPPRIPGVAQWP